MATVITHAVVGAGLTGICWGSRLPWWCWLLGMALAAAPDLDVLAFNLGISYRSPWGHRGWTHSLSLALVVGLVLALLTCQPLETSWLALWGFYFLAAASHGFLDAFNNGGLGVAFFWPFDSRRYFFPWTPVEVSFIGLGSLHSLLRVLQSEMLWIWLPTGLLVGTAMVWRLTGGG